MSNNGPELRSPLISKDASFPNDPSPNNRPPFFLSLLLHREMYKDCPENVWSGIDSFRENSEDRQLIIRTSLVEFNRKDW